MDRQVKRSSVLITRTTSQRRTGCWPSPINCRYPWLQDTQVLIPPRLQTHCVTSRHITSPVSFLTGKTTSHRSSPEPGAAPGTQQALDPRPSKQWTQGACSSSHALPPSRDRVLRLPPLQTQRTSDTSQRFINASWQFCSSVRYSERFNHCGFTCPHP